MGLLLTKETFDKYGYRVEDFLSQSSKMVIVKCDYCGDIVEKPIASYNNQRKNLNKDSCSNRFCINKKLSESKRSKSDNPQGFKNCLTCEKVKPVIEFSKSGIRNGIQDYKSKCKECAKEEYHKTKNLSSEKPFSINEAVVIYEEKINSEDMLPPNFFSRISDLKGFIDYIFKVKTNEYNNKFINFNTDFIREFRLHTLFLNYESIYDIVNTFYPNYIQPWEMTTVSQGYWHKDENAKNAIYWLVDKLKKDNLIENEEDLPKVCSYKLFKDYKLSGLVSCKFNDSTYDAINFAYPNTFKRWNFMVPKNYYDSFNNRKAVLDDFVNTLLTDKVIKNEDEIPHKVNIDTFKEYNLRSFLQHVYSGVTFNAFNEIHPNRWKVWEFKSCPGGFWESKENIVNAIDWLIERLFNDKVINKIKELPNTLTNDIFVEYRLASLYSRREVVYNYLCEKYTESIRIEDFNLCIANDGTKCLSKAEVNLHNFFLENRIDAEYATKKIRFRNHEEDERYAPDWIINGNIIVEYFGLFVDKHYNNSMLKAYKGKTERKIKYYKTLPDYDFLEIYPSDLTSGFRGLKNKLEKLNIQLTEAV